ncbi:MAG: glycosyltransferase family 4 protein [Acidobacteria bacterium]|nr:glycosyltransferase family 4 protein [Acidobacteriota bacterium]MDW7985127.1 glycosyltransferase family 4 protein [Acidobacteriota bacterium]
MRILLYSRVFPPAVGGMERFAEGLASWLAEHGHDVTVVTYTPAAPTADRQRPYRVLRHPDFGTVVRTARRSDVVHVSGLSVRGILAALLVGRRPVVTHHGHQAVCPTGLAWSSNSGDPCPAGPRPGPCRVCRVQGLRGHGSVRVHRAATWTAAVNVCVSRYLAERIDVPHSRVIYDAVSEVAFATQADGPGRDGLVAFAGRLVAEKGVDLLLQALTRVPEACLEIAGDGPMRGPWEALARELGLESRVRFLGSLPLDGIAELYARSAVVGVPSTWDEPFGYAAAEAMAMGRPVVATPRGALPELLADGRGFVARTATPEALAEVLRTALEDERRRREVAARARAFARSQLRWDHAGTTYVRYYRKESPR